MFALDAFSPGLTVWQQIGAFLIHLIPSFILLSLLIVAWRWEFIGGIIFTIIGLGLSPFVFLLNLNRNHLSVMQSLGVILLVTMPFALVGILFIVSYKKKNRKIAHGMNNGTVGLHEEK
jgi:hypothetical protein